MLNKMFHKSFFEYDKLIYETDTKKKQCYIIIKETTYSEEGSTSVYYFNSNSEKLEDSYKIIDKYHINGEGYQEYPVLLEVYPENVVSKENDFTGSVENDKESEVFEKIMGSKGFQENPDLLEDIVFQESFTRSVEYGMESGVLEVSDLEYIQDLPSETEEKTAVENVISLVHNKETLENELGSEEKEVADCIAKFSIGNKEKELLTVERMMLTNEGDDQNKENFIITKIRELLEDIKVKIDLLFQNDIIPVSEPSEDATGNFVSIDENGSSADEYSGIVNEVGNKTKQKKSSAISEREAAREEALEVFRKFLNARWDAEEQKERNDLKKKRDDRKRNEQRKRYRPWEAMMEDFDEDFVKKLNDDSSKLPKRTRKENCG